MKLDIIIYFQLAAHTRHCPRQHKDKDSVVTQLLPQQQPLGVKGTLHDSAIFCDINAVCYVNGVMISLMLKKLS